MKCCYHVSVAMCLALILLAFSADSSSTYAQTGDEFIVESIKPYTPGSDRYDVKIKNKRTKNVHSVTVSIENALQLFVGGRVQERKEGKLTILVPVDRPIFSPNPTTGVLSYRFPVGVVSWIDREHLPFIAPQDAVWAAGAWPNKVCIGLVATANPPAPEVIPDIQTFRNTRQYRAVMWCQVQVDVDQATDKVLQCKIAAEVLDPGWTPPFQNPVAMDFAMKVFEESVRDRTFYSGELSPVSKICTQARHPNSPLDLPATESVVVDGFIKFRAGKHTDDIGIKQAGSPVHVPWVWSSLAVTYAGKGVFHVYTCGSLFPTHRWYVAGVQIRKSLQAEVEMSEKDPTISTGPPANGPQLPDDSNPGTKFMQQRYTMPSGKQMQTSLGILPRLWAKHVP